MSTEPSETEVSPAPKVDEAHLGEGALMKDAEHSDGVADSVAAVVIVLIFVALSIYWIYSQNQIS